MNSVQLPLDLQMRIFDALLGLTPFSSLSSTVTSLQTLGTLRLVSRRNQSEFDTRWRALRAQFRGVREIRETLSMLVRNMVVNSKFHDPPHLWLPCQCTERCMRPSSSNSGGDLMAYFDETVSMLRGLPTASSDVNRDRMYSVSPHFPDCEKLKWWIAMGSVACSRRKVYCAYDDDVHADNPHDDTVRDCHEDECLHLTLKIAFGAIHTYTQYRQQRLTGKSNLRPAYPNAALFEYVLSRRGCRKAFMFFVPSWKTALSQMHQKFYLDFFNVLLDRRIIQHQG